MSTADHRLTSDPFAALVAAHELATAKVQARVSSAEKLFRNVAVTVDQLAARIVPPDEVDTSVVLSAKGLAALVKQLDEQGAASLTTLQQRALAATPKVMTRTRLLALIRQRRSVLRTMARLTLAEWQAFMSEPWGHEYARLLVEESTFRPPRLPLFDARLVSPQDLWSRKTPVAPSLIARAVEARSVSELRHQLVKRCGLRENWQLTHAVALTWLQALERPRLDSELTQILNQPELAAWLLSPRAADQAASIDLGGRAEIVAMFVEAGYGASPHLAAATRSRFIGYLLKSKFGDPRETTLSAGWAAVRERAPAAFRSMLSSLLQQDLELFFRHAMHATDRKTFWLRYLPSIERTGCILSDKSRAELQAKISAQPDMAQALERVHRYDSNEHVHAFYLVFAQCVVIEFSMNGNAAYVYPRQVFEAKFEPRIRTGSIGHAFDLKNRTLALSWIRHVPGWESETDAKMAEHGIFPTDSQRRTTDKTRAWNEASPVGHSVPVPVSSVQPPPPTPNKTPQPIVRPLRPGQVWRTEPGRHRWTLSAAKRRLVRIHDDVDLAGLIGVRETQRYVDAFLQIRPEGGTVLVDNAGNAVTKMGEERIFLGQIHQLGGPENKTRR